MRDVDQRTVQEPPEIRALVDQPAERLHLVDDLVQRVFVIGKAIQGRGIAIDQATAIGDCGAA